MKKMKTNQLGDSLKNATSEFQIVANKLLDKRICKQKNDSLETEVYHQNHQVCFEL